MEMPSDTVLVNYKTIGQLIAWAHALNAKQRVFVVNPATKQIAMSVATARLFYKED